jgi:hypothetical protein
LKLGRPASLFAAFLIVHAVACASTSSAHKAELRRALDRAVVSRGPAEIWPEVQRFLAQRGYPLVGADRVAAGRPAQGSISKLFSVGFETRARADGGRVLETDALKDVRVHVEAMPAAGGGSRLYVRLVKRVEMSLTETTQSRDEDLELALLEQLDPTAAATVAGRTSPPVKSPAPMPPAVTPPAPAIASAPAAPPSAAAPTVAGADPWARLRPLFGSWNGRLADETAVSWRFDLASASQLVEMHGTPILFAGHRERTTGEEVGRVSGTGGDLLVWNQLTNAGKVDRYEAEATGPSDQAIVFVARAPESLPAGARARLSLRRVEDQLEATLDIAEPGKDFAPAGSVRLSRTP